MTLWLCAGCSTAYSVGAPACPHCASKDWYEEGLAAPEVVTEPALEPEAQPAKRGAA